MDCATGISLVNVGNPSRWIAVPFGLAYVGRGLRLHGMDYEMIDLLPEGIERREAVFRRRIAGARDRLFGFGVILGNGNLAETLRFAAMVKEEHPSNRIIFGGPAASAIPGLIFANSQADYIVAGEGEERFPALARRLMDGLPGGGIPGVFAREGGGAGADLGTGPLVPQGKIPKIADLDRYAPPDYDALRMDFYLDYLKDSGRSFDIVASRGCWGNCKFCFRFIGVGCNARGADSVLDEIALVKERWGLDRFAFVDENLFQNKAMFLDIMRGAEKRGLDFKFRCMTRVDNLDEEIAAVLDQGNCLSVSFGVESTSNETLHTMKKRTTVELIESKIAMLHRAGIEARGSFIIGFPGDTEKSFEDMGEFIVRNGLEGHCTVNHLTPLPATALYQEHREVLERNGAWDYVRRVDAASLFRELVVNLTDLPDEVLVAHRERLRALGQTRVVVPERFQAMLRSDGE